MYKSWCCFGRIEVWKIRSKPVTRTQYDELIGLFSSMEEAISSIKYGQMKKVTHWHEWNSLDRNNSRQIQRKESQNIRAPMANSCYSCPSGRSKWGTFLKCSSTKVITEAKFMASSRCLPWPQCFRIKARSEPSSQTKLSCVVTGLFASVCSTISHSQVCTVSCLLRHSIEKWWGHMSKELARIRNIPNT